MCGSARGGWPVCHRHITVITTTTGTGPEGFTCQSFTPLSLDPVPISFNVSRTSRTWPRIQEAETFCVNLLAAHQEPVARAFATQGTARFDGVDYTCEDGNGAPRPAEAAAWPDATIEDTHGGGDHLIVIGRVTAALTAAMKTSCYSIRACTPSRRFRSGLTSCRAHQHAAGVFVWGFWGVRAGSWARERRSTEVRRDTRRSRGSRQGVRDWRGR
ncbi:flavin reductase family protein [Streptomyces sp. MUSC 14]|uniref:flavin reductase family protein n=1 Tax=Streptomyces sp. MUSC 14 TaxID=1354889 RepID=UPI0009A0F550